MYNQKNFGEIKSIGQGNNIHYKIRKYTLGSNDCGAYVASNIRIWIGGDLFERLASLVYDR